MTPFLTRSVAAGRQGERKGRPEQEKSRLAGAAAPSARHITSNYQIKHITRSDTLPVISKIKEVYCYKEKFEKTSKFKNNFNNVYRHQS